MEQSAHATYSQLADTLHASYRAQYTEMVGRLEDPERSYVSFLHKAMEEVTIFHLAQNGIGMAGTFYDPTYSRTIGEIRVVAEENPRFSESAPLSQEMWTVRRFGQALRDKDEPAATKLQALCALGLMAGGNKPSWEVDLRTAVKPERNDNNGGFTIFTTAVSLLQKQLLSEAEETAIRESLDKFQSQLRNPTTARRATQTLNKYSLHLYASGVLARLAESDIHRRDIINETSYLSGRLPAPDPSKLRRSSVPVVAVDWPIFPPGEGKPHPSSRSEQPHQPLPPERLEELKQFRKSRETAVARFIAAWGAEAFAIDATLGQPGKPKYMVAILPEVTPHGIAIHAIAESLVPASAMFILRAERTTGIEVDTTNRETIAASIKKIFNSPRKAAQGYGAHKVVHRKPDTLFKRGLEYLTRSPDKL